MLILSYIIQAIQFFSHVWSFLQEHSIQDIHAVINEFIILWHKQVLYEVIILRFNYSAVETFRILIHCLWNIDFVCLFNIAEKKQFCWQAFRLLVLRHYYCICTRNIKTNAWFETLMIRLLRCWIYTHNAYRFE